MNWNLDIAEKWPNRKLLRFGVRVELRDRTGTLITAKVIGPISGEFEGEVLKWKGSMYRRKQSILFDHTQVFSIIH